MLREIVKVIVETQDLNLKNAIIAQRISEKTDRWNLQPIARLDQELNNVAMLSISRIRNIDRVFTALGVSVNIVIDPASAVGKLLTNEYVQMIVGQVATKSVEYTKRALLAISAYAITQVTAEAAVKSLELLIRYYTDELNVPSWAVEAVVEVQKPLLTQAIQLGLSYMTPKTFSDFYRPAIADVNYYRSLYKAVNEGALVKAGLILAAPVVAERVTRNISNPKVKFVTDILIKNIPGNYQHIVPVTEFLALGTFESLKKAFKDYPRYTSPNPIQTTSILTRVLATDAETSHVLGDFVDNIAEIDRDALSPTTQDVYDILQANVLTTTSGDNIMLTQEDIDVFAPIIGTMLPKDVQSRLVGVFEQAQSTTQTLLPVDFGMEDLQVLHSDVKGLISILGAGTFVTLALAAFGFDATVTDTAIQIGNSIALNPIVMQGLSRAAEIAAPVVVPAAQSLAPVIYETVGRSGFLSAIT